MPRQILNKTDNHDYFKVWSPSMAYILGWHTADGCITKNGNCFVFTFSLNTNDIKILEFIRNEINPNRSIHNSQRKQVSGFISNRSILKITNQTICQDLMNLGFKLRKTYNMVLPNIPEEYKKDYLRGYFEGDGSVQSDGINRRTKRVRLHCIDNIFLETLKNNTINCGKIVQTNKSNNKQGYEWLITGYDDIIKFKNYIYYDNMPCFLERKFEKFQEMEFKDIVITAFGETKTLSTWVKDSRCYLSQRSLYKRYNQYHNIIPTEILLTAPKNKFLFNRGKLTKYVLDRMEKENLSI